MIEQEFFPQRPAVTPSIYAFRLNDVASHTGYIKVGYTERELSKMYYSKWIEIYKKWQWHHNLIVQRRGWKGV